MPIERVLVMLSADVLETRAIVTDADVVRGGQKGQFGYTSALQVSCSHHDCSCARMFKVLVVLPAIAGVDRLRA